MLINLKKKNVFVYLFLIIPLFIYVIFFIVPNFNALYYSFFRWNGIDPVKEFIGLKNYINIFKNPIFLLTLKNTLFYTGALILGQNILGLLIALLIHKKGRIHRIFRSLFFLPAMLSSVAVGLIWGFIYDPTIGVINTFLRGIGLESLTTSWLSNPKIAIFSVVLIHIWIGIGYFMILYIAGLQNIPVELNEAAEVDGTNKIQNFFYVTLPLLKSTILVCLILSTINGFISFDFVYILTRGGADGSSEVLSTLLFKEAFQYSNIGNSAAISVVLLVIVLIISILQIQFFKTEEV